MTSETIHPHAISIAEEAMIEFEIDDINEPNTTVIIEMIQEPDVVRVELLGSLKECSQYMYDLCVVNKKNKKYKYRMAPATSLETIVRH